MGVTLQERMIGNIYRLQTPGREYSAYAKPWSMGRNVRIVTDERREVAWVAAAGLLGKRCLINIDGWAAMRFRRTKFWRNVYTCSSPTGELEVYAHRGWRYSVFDGERQIAIISRMPVVIGDAAYYAAEADDDVDGLFLGCVMMALHLLRRNADKGTSFTWLQERAMDAEWEPEVRGPGARYRALGAVRADFATAVGMMCRAFSALGCGLPLSQALRPGLKCSGPLALSPSQLHMYGVQGQCRREGRWPGCGQLYLRAKCSSIKNRKHSLK